MFQLASSTSEALWCGGLTRSCESFFTVGGPVHDRSPIWMLRPGARVLGPPSSSTESTSCWSLSCINARAPAIFRPERAGLAGAGPRRGQMGRGRCCSMLGLLTRRIGVGVGRRVRRLRRSAWGCLSLAYCYCADSSHHVLGPTCFGKRPQRPVASAFSPRLVEPRLAQDGSMRALIKRAGSGSGSSSSPTGSRGDIQWSQPAHDAGPSPSRPDVEEGQGTFVLRLDDEEASPEPPGSISGCRRLHTAGPILAQATQAETSPVLASKPNSAATSGEIWIHLIRAPLVADRMAAGCRRMPQPVAGDGAGRRRRSSPRSGGAGLPMELDVLLDSCHPVSSTAVSVEPSAIAGLRSDQGPAEPR